MANKRVGLAFRSAAASTVLLLATAACSDNTGPRAASVGFIACDEGGPSCGTGATVGVTPSSDASTDVALDSGGDGSIQTVSVSGSVIRYTDTEFIHWIPYTGAGQVGVPTPLAQVSVPIGADAGNSFQVSNALVGAYWWLMTPLYNLDLMATYSLLTLRSDAVTVEVPVMDRTLFATIYATAGTLTMMNANASQVVAVFYNNDVRASGVKITLSSLFADAILYDAGSGGGYQMDTQLDAGGKLSTGNLGTVIFQNVTSGSGGLSYTFKGKSYVTDPINYILGGASLAEILIPQ